MAQKLNIYSTISLLTISISALAAENNYNIPKEAFFAGAGGSYNSLSLNRDTYASGVSNVYLNSVLAGSGQAGGPANPYHDTQSTFAPEIQAGYFKTCTDSNWLWGAKFSYKYLGSTSTQKPVLDPQHGTIDNILEGSSDTMAGNVVIDSMQTEVKHQINLIPFVGHSFEKGHIYFGVGPSLFQIRSSMYGVTGYADINGIHENITGTASNFSSTDWVWGGASTLGMTYYFDSSWFADMNYTIAISRKYKNNHSAYFASASAGYTDTGTIYANESQRSIVQAIGISINKTF